MTTVDVGTVFVVGEHSFAVRESRVETPRSMTVTVTMDGRFEWSFEEPGWRPMSFGASPDVPYLWSARELIVLPGADVDELEVARVDEDLLYVFRVDGGWLMVCETSVRRVLGGQQTDRIELGDVVVQVRWSQGVLHLLDEVGVQQRVRVQGAGLVVDSA